MYLVSSENCVPLKVKRRLKMLLSTLWPDTVVVFQWEPPCPRGSRWATTLWSSGKSTQGKLPAMLGSFLLNHGKIILEMSTQKTKQQKEDWKIDWVPSLKKSQLNLKDEVDSNICLCSSSVLFPVVCGPFFLSPLSGLHVHAAVLCCWPQPQTGFHQSTECSAGTTSQALLTGPPCQGELINAQRSFSVFKKIIICCLKLLQMVHKKNWILFSIMATTIL